MAVVNTPDNIPAANSCGYLQESMHMISHTTLARLKHQLWQRGLREYIIWGFLLQLLAQSEPKEADSKHGCDSDDGGRHAFVEPFQTLWERRGKTAHCKTSSTFCMPFQWTESQKIAICVCPHLFGQGLFETINGPSIQEALSRLGFGLSL